MFEQILSTSEYVVKNAKDVKINYGNADKLIDELRDYNSKHYLTSIPYDVIGMSTENIIDFLVVYDSIDYSFWGEPKWTIETPTGLLDGGIALLYCIFDLFKDKDSREVFHFLELMSIDEFKEILKGNVEIPLLIERYNTVTNIAKIVNNKMNGSFYEYIKDVNNDSELFNIIISNFDSFNDTRTYNDEKIYFYKLAQLLTSDILHILEIKENRKVDYSHLIGCADYKIPQVMESLGILEYNENLLDIIKNKKQIPESDKYEVEIRASMIVVINYLYKKLEGIIPRIDINDFIWLKGQDKSKNYNPYHLTRTTSY